MTNLIAFILMLTSTNWESTGVFVPKSTGGSGRVDIQEGRRVTNTVAVFQWRNQEVRVILETNLGPVVGERRVPIQNTYTYPPMPMPPYTARPYTVTNAP